MNVDRVTKLLTRGARLVFCHTKTSYYQYRLVLPSGNVEGLSEFEALNQGVIWESVSGRLETRLGTYQILKEARLSNTARQVTHG